jgi:hypothetical protein
MLSFHEGADGSTIELGNSGKIQSVVEQELPFLDFRQFFPDLTSELLEEHRSWLEPNFLDPASGNAVLRVQSYVVRTPHHNVLIDPCNAYRTGCKRATYQLA